MQEITLAEFITAIEEGSKRNTRYFVENMDDGTVYLYLPGSMITVSRADGELEIFSPGQRPEVFLGFRAIEQIYREGRRFSLRLRCGLSDITITEESNESKRSH